MMNITPRRKDRTISLSDAEAIFDKTEYGYLSLKSDDEYPYGIPINFVKDGRTLYMHCADVGRKIDCISGGSKASFCTVERAIVVPQKFTLSYKSAIAFGKISIVNNDEEKRKALLELLKKFSPDDEELGKAHMEHSFARTTILKFEIEGLSGKEKIMPKTTAT